MKNLTQKNEKLKQAKKFIPGLTVTVQKRESYRNKYGLAWRYAFSIATKKGIYRAIFTDSVYNYNNNIPVNLDDVLYCWIVDAECFECSKDFKDFCLQFGYDFKNYDELGKQQVDKAWSGCKFAYEKMTELLTDKEIEKLHDLFQDY